MMTDASLIEWARGWLREPTPEDPNFKERFEVTLAEELRFRAARPSGDLVKAWKKMAMELCWEIEKLPCSTEVKALSLRASALHGALQDALYDYTTYTFKPWASEDAGAL
jgi:hypothetical protein